jgi:hypothetical protein
LPGIASFTDYFNAPYFTSPNARSNLYRHEKSRNVPADEKYFSTQKDPAGCVNGRGVTGDIYIFTFAP